jgi:3-phosphoshikimate 1-carboxyvinyltransferase
MPIAVVRPSSLHGTVTLPPSKSHTMRSLVLAAVAQGRSTIIDPLLSPDTEAMVSIITALGAKVHGHSSLQIEGIGGCMGRLGTTSVDVGNSGLALRFATAFFALCCDPITITGDASIRHLRPIGPLVQSLRSLGLSASFLEKDGFAPICIHGPIHAGSCVVDGTDSQPVSALLLALPLLEGYSLIRVENMGERPWVEVTLSTLHALGVTVERHHKDVFGIPGQQRFQGFSRKVPKDASALAFPLVAALTTDSDVEIRGVPFHDVQNDIVIIDYIRRMGGTVDCYDDRMTVRGPKTLQGIDIDINEAVDAFPILAVLATKVRGKTRLFNGAVCRTKESDRIRVMAGALQKMGAAVVEHPDGLTIYESSLHGATLYCHADHRVAMALSVAALCANGTTYLHGVECVSKSFPQFFSMLKTLGAEVDVVS